MDVEQSLEIAIRRAQEVLWKAQAPSGGWDARCHYGPWCTAQTLLTLDFVGQLDPDLARDAVRWLVDQQDHDGSFVPYPYHRQGDRAPTPDDGSPPADPRLCATASVWGALRLFGDPEHEENVARARRYVDAHGGLPRVVEEVKHGDFAALFLALPRLVTPDDLPALPSAFTIAKPLEIAAIRELGFFAPMIVLILSLTVRYLRGEWGRPGAGRLPWQDVERKRCIDLLEEFQNPNGSIDDNTWQTNLGLVAFHAAGLPSDDPRIRRAVRYLKEHRLVREPDGGAWFTAFGYQVWATSLALRALLQSGVPGHEKRIERSVRFLLSCQIDVPQLAVENPNPRVPHTGGWGLERANLTMVDSDDTAVAMATIAMALQRGLSGTGPHNLAELARRALYRADAWLMGMQDAPTGGWGAFATGSGGPMPHPERTMQHLPTLPTTARSALRLLAHPGTLGSDPPTADVTARALCALGALGYGRSAATVRNGLAFLKAQAIAQPGGGRAFWGRWIVNYLPATAYALLGLAAVDGDLGEEWVRASLSWMLDCQRDDDGGWGEDPDSYMDPSRAGRGRQSMPPITGLVVTALLDLVDRGVPGVDRGRIEGAIQKGVAYLLEAQREDGTWPDNGFLHTNIPPATYYNLPISGMTYPLEALGVHRRRLLGLPASVPKDLAMSDMPAQTGARPSATAWPDALLDRARRWGDPAADALIAEIYGNARKLDWQVHEADRVFGRVMRNRDPGKLREELGAQPGAIVEGVEAFFARTLPTGWPSPEDLAVAERLFARCSMGVVFALFLSSLPQCYAGAKGAQVLYRSMNLRDMPELRIFRVGQFLFDVMGPGAFAPGGKAVPAILKVRLLHGSLRHLSQRYFWEDAWGLPVNQEDLAGTLLSFSCVVVDALRALGVAVSDDEAERWQRAWNGVGHLLGVHEALLPESYAAGGQLMQRIRDRQWAPSFAGKQLTHVLVNVLRALNWFRAGGQLWPAAAIRRLAGDRCADVLGLATPDALGKAYTRLDDAFCGWLSRTRLAQPLGGAAAQAILAHRLRKVVLTPFGLSPYLAR